MSLRATITVGLTVREPITDPAGYTSASQNTVTVDGGNVTETLTGSTTPPVTAHAVGAQALSAGSGALDLRALTGTEGQAVDLNGLKPRAILFENPPTNANPITVAQGASNGYTGLGSAFRLTLQPGQKVLLRLGASGAAVSGTVRTLDLTGTGAQALKYQIVAGA